LLRLIKIFKWQEAIPRMAADIMVVHFSMIAAFAISGVYQTGARNSAEAAALVSAFRRYYTAFFLLLSPMFLPVFLLNGFYTSSRAHSNGYKMWVIIPLSVTFAAMVFCTGNFLILGNQNVGRRVALPFLLLAATGVASVRILRNLLEKPDAL